MRLIGVRLLVVTNAAGGLNQTFNVGDIMVIQDHFGLVRIGWVFADNFRMGIHSFMQACKYTYILWIFSFQPSIAGCTPLRGENNDRLGPRFPSLSDAYDEKLQAMVLDAAEKLQLGQRVRKNGTYCFLSGQFAGNVMTWSHSSVFEYQYISGPTYETKAECRFLRSVGGDAVGMSTIPEVIAAKHCGMKILGLSLITNKGRCSPPCTEITSWY